MKDCLGIGLSRRNIRNHATKKQTEGTSTGLIWLKISYCEHNFRVHKAVESLGSPIIDRQVRDFEMAIRKVL
jgi:hypothetical protein